MQPLIVFDEEQSIAEVIASAEKALTHLRQIALGRWALDTNREGEPSLISLQETSDTLAPSADSRVESLRLSWRRYVSAYRGAAQ